MPNDRVDTGDPSGAIPEATGALDGPTRDRAQDTLAYQLTDVADDLRGLYADFGLRPYRVFLVHAEWPGERRGYGGALVVTSRREILPVPRVRSIGAVQRQIQALGGVEVGDVTIDQISARYTEDDLMGRTPDQVDQVQGRTLRRNVEFWWEIEENRGSTPNPIIRRFSGPVRTPEVGRGAMAWSVTLTKQDNDRGRDGATLPRTAP